MNLLVLDIGGNNVKIWRTGFADKLKVPSGRDFTPQMMVKRVKEAIGDWEYHRVSIGYPGHVINGRPVKEPYNLGDGWVDFDYETAFGRPLRIMNDSAMQALGSYEGGRMLYLGLGTGFGTALVIDGHLVPLELGHLLLTPEYTFEASIGRIGLEELGEKRWQKMVSLAVEALQPAFLADYVVLGGGNVKKIEELPEGCRRGGNERAFLGGVRMWDDIVAAGKPSAFEQSQLRVG